MIESYSFGSIVINGEHYRHDIKIINKSVIPEWWRENGHRVSVADITDLVEAAPDIIVIGMGASGRMIPDADVIALLQNKAIELIKASTGDAVKTFNRLIRNKKNIAAGFHLSC